MKGEGVSGGLSSARRQPWGRSCSSACWSWSWGSWSACQMARVQTVHEQGGRRPWECCKLDTDSHPSGHSQGLEVESLWSTMSYFVLAVVKEQFVTCTLCGQVLYLIPVGSSHHCCWWGQSLWCHQQIWWWNWIHMQAYSYGQRGNRGMGSAHSTANTAQPDKWQ